MLRRQDGVSIFYSFASTLISVVSFELLLRIKCLIPNWNGGSEVDRSGRVVQPEFGWVFTATIPCSRFECFPFSFCAALRWPNQRSLNIVIIIRGRLVMVVGWINHSRFRLFSMHPVSMVTFPWGEAFSWSWLVMEAVLEVLVAILVLSRYNEFVQIPLSVECRYKKQVLEWKLCVDLFKKNNQIYEKYWNNKQW